MDTLTHLMLSLAGGYLLTRGIRPKLSPYAVPLLAAASILIDVDHLPPHFGVAHTLVLHNVFFVLAAAVVIRFLVGKEYALIASVMLLGHLLFDMDNGIYGVPLFYPLSKAAFLIPEGWEVWLFGDPSYTVISRTGIALALYLGLIGCVFSLRPSSRRGA